MRGDYKVEIKECSRDLTHKERVKLTDTTSAIRLDTATQEQGSVLINPDFYAVLHVHNEHSEDKDYDNYIIVDKDGNRYLTGSSSFFDSFVSIMEDMAGCDEEYQIKAYRSDSKNRPGKQFITCEIV